MEEEKLKQETMEEEKEIVETKEKSKKNAKKEIKERKTEAVVNGKDLPISTKHAVAICNFIRNKNVDVAVYNLEQVLKFKKPVPMRGEIPHRKGIMSGRYPIKATAEFIKLLKSLKANAMVNELELEKYKIFCKANIASRPYKRFGTGRFKRSHVTLKLTEIKKNKTKEKKK